MTDLNLAGALEVFANLGDNSTLDDFEKLVRQVSVAQRDGSTPPVAYAYSGPSNPYEWDHRFLCRRT